MIKLLRKLNVNHWLTLGALMLGVIAFVRDCSQDRRQDRRAEDFDYWRNALQYQPVLEVVGSPSITSVEVVTGEMKLSDFQVFPDSGDSFIDVSSTLSINARLTVVNTGKALGIVYALFWSDTLSGGAKIRDRLLDEKLRENGFISSPTSDYFEIRDMRPGDTAYFEVAHDVGFVEEDNFTMHFLFLYRNEMGALYDTYYWARYRTSSIVFKPEVANIDGKPMFRVGVEKSQFKEFLQLTDDHKSWRTYSKSEALDIDKFFRRYRNKHENGS